MYCTQCGFEILKTTKFCPNCGSKVESLSYSENNNEEIHISGEIDNNDFRITSINKENEIPLENNITEEVKEIKVKDINLKNYQNIPLPNSSKKEKTKWNGYQIFLFLFLIFTIYSLIKEIVIPFTNTTSSKNEVENSDKGCSGFGNENCQTQVINSIEKQNKQIFNITYSNNGKFIVTVSDPKRMENFMTTITTDCNCQIIKVE